LAGEDMKIFELLDELKEEINSSPKSAFSNKRSVDLEIVNEILHDLKTVIPEELAQAQKLMEDKDKVISEAKAKADEIIKSAQEELAKKVSEDVVTATAEENAQELMNTARNNAKEITMGAKEYADDIMKELEVYFADYLKLIRKNRLQLASKRKTDQRPPNTLL
jgi:vacuolar-type H+-ATPase subunit H